MPHIAPACPQGDLEKTYADGDNLVCPDCTHEWPEAKAGATAEEAGSTAVKDANGNPLADGDSLIRLKDLNLETAVGRARVGHCGPVWVGETTQQACCRKAEQRPQAGPQWLNRARSAITQKVRLRAGTKVRVHAAFQAEMSGQLRFFRLKVKGSSSVLKRGSKIRGMRLVDGNDGHNLDCKAALGSMLLKSEFLKQA